MLRHLFIAFIVFTNLYANAQKAYKYPIAPKDSVFNDYFDTTIYDPYQWMENPDDFRLTEWMEAQKRITKKQGNKHTKIWTLRAQIGMMYSKISGERIEGYVEKEDKYKSKYEFNYKYKSYRRTPDLLYRKRGTSHFKTLVRIKKFQSEKDKNVNNY